MKLFHPDLPRPARIAGLLLVFAALGPVRAGAEPATLIVTNALLVPLDGSAAPPFRGYLVVGADGRIAAIGPGEAPGSGGPRLDVQGRIVMPGFISGHNHLSQSVTRGRAAGSWVTEWGGGGRGGAAATRTLQAGDTYAAVLHGALDMLYGGITTVYNYALMTRTMTYDDYFETFTAEIEARGRFIFGYGMPESHGFYSRDQQLENLRRFLHESRSYPGNERMLKVSIASVAMRWTEDVSHFEFDALKAFPELKMDMQMHFLEPPPNVPRTQYERANFEWLKKYGILGPNLTFAHFVHPTEDILRESAAAGATMIWNPLSNARLGSGLSDIPRYLRLGITVGMGIDGQASADIADPFQNMRVGLYSLRALRADPAVMSPHQMLLLHTLGTARALRVEREVGSLEVGKFADFIVVDPDDPSTGLSQDPYATLVFSCSRANVTDVYVGGEPVIRNREFVNIDLRQFQRNTRYRMGRQTEGGGP